ncbi:lasso peptide biosynthesis B2 protein [Sphingopyxis alaskensis]|jgi:hypothetical protein|uniref:lasso peptide biosynthesis B2 protein n=1 Tax=Sphingopyxis alaskensis TaxID=117207 RepID=UPI0020425ABF|nr:lasso peptide biosynthesis B2 protein [Sphingopyxis alaskensis]MCM3420954.1 lasso peptide biosynthesis B2 protein [Sphingopyxis alaskensis]
MPLQLRDGVFQCFCGTRAIFLDSQANRYFALPPKKEVAFRKIVDNERLDRCDRELVEELVTDGVLARSPMSPSAHWPEPIPAPVGDLPRAMAERPSAFLVLKAICARLWARRLVDGNGIAELRRLLERLPKPDSTPRGSSPNQRLAELISAFDLADRLISARDQCLPRSLAMHRLAKAFGANVHMVLGVRAEPFAAHCWVEFEQRVITGDFEQARLFTPIMRIE